jgi:hypothetical protein
MLNEETKDLIDIISRSVAKGLGSGLEGDCRLDRVSERRRGGVKPVVKPLNREHGIYYLANEDKMNRESIVANADLELGMRGGGGGSLKGLDFIKRNKASVNEARLCSKNIFFKN